MQDVAARLPNYWHRLTPQQRQTMLWLQETIAPYRQLWDEVGARDIGSRTDIMDGGFYLPRGRADLEGVDAPAKVFAGPKRTGKAGFEKSATFDSMAEGIGAGYEYSPLRDSIRSYVKDAGTRIADRHVANYLHAATDDAGVKLASTVADRIDPGLRKAVTTLRAKIGGRQETLLRRDIRAKYAHLDAERQSKAFTEEWERVLKAREREEFLRQTKWAGSTEKEISFAQGQLRELIASAKRQGRRADIRAESAQAAGERLSDTASELKNFQRELDGLGGRWKSAQDKARQTPRGMGQVGLVELQGTSFPDVLANAANKVLASEAGPTGLAERSVKGLNSLVRGMRSTGEMSYLGIQGAAGMAKDQPAYAKALSVATRAWGIEGDRMLGAYLKEFNERALKEGLPDSISWTRNGTHIGGAETEYTLGAGLAGKAGELLKNAPLIRQANRGFGYFGDTLRTEWAQNELRTVMRRTGKPWQQLESEGEMQSIAEAVNRATGWTNDRAAGDLGELVLFAPRFFQSRLETLGKAGQGMRPGAPIDQAIARDSLIKLIGGATLLTYAINEYRGEKTDFRPWTYDNNGHASRNPNFMRLRNIGGRDWSLLGQWDSLLSVMIDTATGQPLRALRTMASPVMTDVWDIVGGRDFLGKPTRDTPAHFAQWVANAHVPFFATGLGDVGKAVGEGQYGQAAGVSGALFVGAKGSPLSYTDVRQNIAQSKYKTDWTDLTPSQRYEVEQSSELKQRVLEFPPDDTGTPEQGIAKMFERRDVQLTAAVTDLEKAIDRGLKGKELAAEIKDYRTAKYQINADFMTPEVLAEMERTKSKTPISTLQDEYYSFRLEQPDGELDFDGQERHRINVLEKAKAQGIDPKEVTFKKPLDNTKVQTVLDAYDADMETLKPYYELRDRSPVPGHQAAYDKVQSGVKPETLTDAEWQSWKMGETWVADTREQLRRENGYALDAVGLRWGKWTSSLKEQEAGKLPKLPRSNLPPLRPLPKLPLPAGVR